MKKRLIAILMTLTLVLTYMPAIAFAEGECSHENAQFVEGYDPTCVDTGLSGYWYCDDCGKYFANTDVGMDDSVAFDSEEDFELPIDEDAHPEGLAYVEGYEASCREEGQLDYYECPYCGQMYADAEGTQKLAEEDIVIPKLAHVLEHIDAYESDIITEQSNNEYWFCEECGSYFLDSEGQNEVEYEDVYYYNAPNQEKFEEVIQADDEAWDMADGAEEAVKKANSSIASGNIAAAINDSNAALAIARAAQNAANNVMAKAKQYINENADELTEEDVANLTAYVQVTVNRANNAVAGANSAVAAATNLKLEADRNGVYDGSLPKVKAKKPAAKKANITAKWKKLNKKQLKKSKATHYEIWVCPNPGFARGQTIEKIVKKSKASLKVKGLQKKTKYYVRVRAVKYVGGVKYVGAWSQKTIKTKK